ncbi:MAG: AMP-binding protein [Oscillospiraceae bacterium]|jgi:phenylacetate-coenzyme A ligase PaaK-like adenylate-forming protein|nr:AMP-binding protein [Oscillospiraceae bacterium]
MNPLTLWLGEKLGTAAPSRAALDAHQLRRLRETLAQSLNSRHYRERFRDHNFSGATAAEVLQALPFSSPSELRAEPLAFLAVPPDAAERVVTLPTSGTTGQPKRVYFSAAELENTAHFFQFGMQNIARRGGRVMLFMRGGEPGGFAASGGVCDLVTRAVARFGCSAVTYGEVDDAEHARAALLESGADCAVGVAAQMLKIARLPGRQPRLKSVLLSADNIPAEIAAELENRWNCEVFRHYGMTETAFGGAVDCGAHAGMHIREPDMIFEIIDPISGVVLPDGERGEVVLTTLTRRVMPLVRYRTGDFSRIIPGDCACGCPLKRLDNVEGHR